jgi:hypothetical protein
MPREGWIKWKTSAAKQILMDDLQSGILAVDPADMPAEEASDICYSHMAEFVPVVFSQFKERLRDHCKQVGADITRAARELEYLAHDRSLFPRQTENHRGEPVLDLSAEKIFLCADVAEGKHHQLAPSQLQQSRVEYHPFSAKNFKHRIYQEVCRQKFVNYLNQRRAQGLT